MFMAKAELLPETFDIAVQRSNHSAKIQIVCKINSISKTKVNNEQQKNRKSCKHVILQ